MSTTLCVHMDCKDCHSHVIKGGKLGCNYNNRLGLGKPALAEVVEEEIMEEEPDYKDANEKEEQIV